MTAIAATAWKVNMKMRAMMFGPYHEPGATIKVIKVVPATTNYAAGGVTLDLSAHFKHRLYWCVPMNPTARDATTGFLQVGYEPGTALANTPGNNAGGWNPADGKYVLSSGATECTASDQSAHTLYFVACGC